MKPEQQVQEEEELRLLLDAHRRIHDCEDARCTMDPDGKKITKTNPGQKRPAYPQKTKQLFKKYRGKDLV